jgi:O-antigen/teichoic acid export membrane protein
MILWAFLNRTIWALVAGNIISALLRTWISHHLLPGHKNRFAWDRSASSELFSFGRWIFISTAAMYLASQADRMILGKLFSLSLLGVYTIALTLAEFPKQIISTLSGKIIFPLATHYAGNPRSEFKKTILKKRLPLLYSFAFCIALMACTGDWLIQILYDDRYKVAGIMLPILALGTWPLLLYSTHEACLLALGKSHFKAIGNTALFVYLLFALPVAFHMAGVVGVVFAIFLKEIPTYLWVAWGSMKEGIYSLRQDCLVSLFLLFLVGSFFCLRYCIIDMPLALSDFSIIGN